MSKPYDIASSQPPSTTKILVATVVALIVAAFVLVVAVLPAEYGVDPLGTGKALGLMDLAKAGESGAVVSAGAYEGAVIAPVLKPATGSSRWGAAAPHLTGAFIPQPGGYKIDSREITLAVGEGMEIKYNMKKGAGLIYSWKASQKLLYEFHGVPDVKPADMGVDYFESYELNEDGGKDQFNGTFIAPSTGIHGWFWQNTTAAPVTLKLISAGFYDWILENRNDKETALDPMEPK